MLIVVIGELTMENVQLYKDLLDYENLGQDEGQNSEHLIEKVEKETLKTIITIAHTFDAKDSYKCGHSEKVAKYSVEIARRMGIKGSELSNLYYSALLHDIGRIGIPDAIIGKPSTLTKDEYDIVKTHTLMGDNILEKIAHYPKIREGVRHHHERYDGLGYPDRLKGELIPLNARIISIADAYDAMKSNRAYRKGFTITEIKKEIYRCKETQFDPFIADILLEMIDEGFDLTTDMNYLVDELDSISENIAMMQRVIKTYAEQAYNNYYKDTLTNVWNREYIKKYVDEYLRDSLNRGIMFVLDLDNFKCVNDIYGHSAGDEMIIALAKTMRQVIGDLGLIARIGGDEFVIFFPNEDNTDYVQLIADKIIDSMKSKIDSSRKGYGVSVSIGIAQSDILTNNFDKLFDNADKALYYVKEHGKGNSHSYNNKEFTTNDDKNIEADVTYLKKNLGESGKISGAYRVGYDGFTKIYQFVIRRMERTNQVGILVLFTILDSTNYSIDNGVLSAAMITLENAIVKSIRKGDVTTRYSDFQQLVMILDTDQNSGRQIVNRIKEIFKQNFNNKVEIKYELENIGL